MARSKHTPEEITFWHQHRRWPTPAEKGESSTRAPAGAPAGGHDAGRQAPARTPVVETFTGPASKPAPVSPGPPKPKETPSGATGAPHRSGNSLYSRPCSCSRGRDH